MNVHLFTKYSSNAVLDQIDIKTKGKTKTKQRAQVTFLTGWAAYSPPISSDYQV